MMRRNQAALRLVPSTREEASIATPRGASATIEGERLVLRDPQGVVVVVYDAATGSATIAAPRGDLRLAAPHGKVVVEAGEDLELSSRTTARIRAVELDCDADLTRFRSKATDVAAGVMQVTSETVALCVGRWNVTADRMIERANNVFRTVQGVIETRAGRVRSRVRETTQIRSGATSITSDDDTFIDGRRVLLG